MNASLLSRSMAHAVLAAAFLAAMSAAHAESGYEAVVGGPEVELSDSGFDLTAGSGVPVGVSPQAIAPQTLNPYVQPPVYVGPQAVNPYVQPPMVVGPQAVNPYVQPPMYVGPQPVNPYVQPQVVCPPFNQGIQNQPYRLGFRGQDIGWGVRVMSLSYSGAAKDIGLEPGDVIVGLNGQPVRSMSDYHAIMAQSGGYVELVVRDSRSGNTVTMPAFTLAQPGLSAGAVAGY